MKQTSDTTLRLPAEWERQAAIQIAWPHEATDWAPYLDEADACYRSIAREVARRLPLLIVSPEPRRVEAQLDMISDLNRRNVCIVECLTNDTWARDHVFLTLVGQTADSGAAQRQVLDFGFNGWGMKFAANYDNQINSNVFPTIQNMWRHLHYVDCRNVILEGGSIESDGRGTILTTTGCLLAPNRNYYGVRGAGRCDIDRGKAEAERMLRASLHAERVLWLDHGLLVGDDTDGHIDTLARLCPDDTIVYVKCSDTSDCHYAELSAMEDELRAMRTADGRPYRLRPLPLPDAIYDSDGERLPATYANFLVVNAGDRSRAVLMPTYDQPANDERARCVLAEVFVGFDIVGIDCRVLIRQHGSLHCATMQYPSESL